VSAEKKLNIFIRTTNILNFLKMS